MPAHVIPMRGSDTPSDERALFSDDDVRSITELGDTLIKNGRASGMRRFSSQTGNDVFVVLDNDGVIEFGIEKHANGYQCFDCDCETIASAADLGRLLRRFS